MIKSLTIEKQAGAAPERYNLTRDIPAGTIILNSARVDFKLNGDPPNPYDPDDYTKIPKSISLELGNVTSSQYVIDNDPDNFYFKVVLELNIVQVGSDYYLSSTTYPATSFKMSDALYRQCVFKVRDATGTEIQPDYFCFHFTVVN